VAIIFQICEDIMKTTLAAGPGVSEARAGRQFQMAKFKAGI
jgi:hypothetical protein